MFFLLIETNKALRKHIVMINSYMKYIKKSNSGFSFMELMIVIAIIGITSGIGIATYPRDDYKVKKVVRGISADIQRTKMLAIRSGQNHRMVFNPAGGYTIVNAVTLAVDKTVNFTGQNSGVVWDTAVPSTIPGGAAPGDGISYGANILTFNPRGLGNQGYVYLNLNNNRYGIGTFASGIIILRRHDGAVWQ